MQKTHLSRKQCEIERYGPIFDPVGYMLSQLALFVKNRFPPFLAAMLNICIKNKNTFLLVMVPDILSFGKTLLIGMLCFFCAKTVSPSFAKQYSSSFCERYFKDKYFVSGGRVV